MRISDCSSDVCSSDLLKDKRMHSQSPKSRLIRIVSNITVAASGGSDVLVSSNFILGEARSGQHQSLFARATHLLKQGADGFKILGKKVYLINNDEPMRNVKIRRASCSERVCQYVSISVVAESLKKKQ